MLSEPQSIPILDLVKEWNLPDQNAVFCEPNRVEDIILFVLVQTAGHECSPHFWSETLVDMNGCLINAAPRRVLHPAMLVQNNVA